jgi:hypothetical protein
MSVVARFGYASRVTETDEEIIVHGHQNAGGECPEERFAKPEHRMERNDEEVRIIKD